MMFKHFDKDKSGRLNHQEFKSCLRALGYDIPMMEEGQPDIREHIRFCSFQFLVLFPIISNIHFNTMLLFADIVDPNRDGYVSLQEYMAFMISKETENVQSSEEIENAFRAITAADRPYVTKEELYAVSVVNVIEYSKYELQYSCNHEECNLYVLIFFSEPHERDGRLLCCPYETLCRSQNGTTDNSCIGLYFRIYVHPFPD